MVEKIMRNVITWHFVGIRMLWFYMEIYDF